MGPRRKGTAIRNQWVQFSKSQFLDPASSLHTILQLPTSEVYRANLRKIRYAVSHRHLKSLVCVTQRMWNFGSKQVLTFVPPIPAAVISMASGGFRAPQFRRNNIVHPLPPPRAPLSSIIFVLPGRIMIGWWGPSFRPFWISSGLCVEGILGCDVSISERACSHFRLP